ncbi:MAG TPA: hypothetical protein VLE49_14040 [Anaerolineales bacterium]|nr:hypothetical protein [Anaerolineales bacterium]
MRSCARRRLFSPRRRNSTADNYATHKHPAVQKWLERLALTGYGQPNDREHASAAGFDDHLTKPVGPETPHRDPANKTVG